MVIKMSDIINIGEPILIKNGILVDANFNNEKKDMLVSNGKIKNINDNIPTEKNYNLIHAISFWNSKITTYNIDNNGNFRSLFNIYNSFNSNFVINNQ